MTVVAETFTFPRSSNLVAASYEPDVENLTVEFENGSRYTYYSVPAATYRGLTLAPSAGQYFYRQIRSRFAFDQTD